MIINRDRCKFLNPERQNLLLIKGIVSNYLYWTEMIYEIVIQMCRNNLRKVHVCILRVRAPYRILSDFFATSSRLIILHKLTVKTSSSICWQNPLRKSLKCRKIVNVYTLCTLREFRLRASSLDTLLIKSGCCHRTGVW